MVRKKITGFCQKRVQFGDFFLKILFVYRLASHPLVRMHPKKDQLNQRKRAQMINQQSNFYRSELRPSCRITTSVSKSANLKRSRAFER